MQKWKVSKLEQYYKTKLYEASGDDSKINKNQIAKLFGLSAQNLNNYIKRKNWNDLSEFIYVPLELSPGIKRNQTLGSKKSKLTGEMLEKMFELARIIDENGKHKYSNEDLADKLGISTSTFYKYQQENINFYKAYRNARRLGVVEDAMFSSAVGYQTTEITEEDIVSYGKITGQKKKKNVTKVVQGDVRAQKYLMSNIVPDEYTENKKVEQKIIVSEELDISNLTDEQIEKLVGEVNGDKG